MEVTIDARGEVQTVRITESSGLEGLDQAAAAAVRQFTFRPGRMNGKPVAATMTIPFEFNLEAN